MRRNEQSCAGLHREAIFPAPSTHRLSIVLLVSTVLILLGGIVDGVMWRYSTERDDLRRHHAEISGELDRIRSEHMALQYRLDAATAPANCLKLATER